MKRNYINPSIEVKHMRVQGMLATSNPKIDITGPGGDESEKVNDKDEVLSNRNGWGSKLWGNSMEEE